MARPKRPQPPDTVRKSLLLPRSVWLACQMDARTRGVGVEELLGKIIVAARLVRRESEKKGRVTHG